MMVELTFDEVQDCIKYINTKRTSSKSAESSPGRTKRAATQ